MDLRTPFVFGLVQRQEAFKVVVSSDWQGLNPRAGTFGL